MAILAPAAAPPRRIPKSSQDACFHRDKKTGPCAARACFIFIHAGNVPEWKGYPMTIITCSVSTVSLALTLISFTVPLAGA
jgi:hypothetical protein